MRLLTIGMCLLPSMLLANTQTNSSFKDLESKYSGKLGIYSVDDSKKSSARLYSQCLF
ncbi:hypothetical protein QIW31_06300 [Francisellaceae bacterium CB299]